MRNWLKAMRDGVLISPSDLHANSFILEGFVFGLIALLVTGCATAPVPERLQFLGYEGNVNEHSILIHSPPSKVFSILTDFDQFSQLAPQPYIRLTKVTPGPVSVGTVFCTETGYKIKTRWQSQVVEEHKDEMLILRFMNGIFSGGYEVWEIQPMRAGTKVSHTILYNISSFPYRILWVLKNIENKHNALVEATLQKLKDHCERTLSSEEG
jgi:uncharacterized membrane protein